MVEGTSQIMDSITDDERSMITDLRHTANTIDHSSFIWLILP
jgi:hypothetical protein